MKPTLILLAATALVFLTASRHPSVPLPVPTTTNTNPPPPTPAPTPPRPPTLLTQALPNRPRPSIPNWPLATFQYTTNLVGPWRTAFLLTNGPRPVILFDLSDPNRQPQMTFYRFLPFPEPPPVAEFKVQGSKSTDGPLTTDHPLRTTPNP